MMRRRSNAGLFDRVLRAGSRTTYHAKLRTRGGKTQATTRAGKQSIYKGVRIIPVGNGEFETSLDSSRFESKRDAQRFIAAWKKRGNPASYRGMSVAKLEQIRPFVAARVYDNDWMVRQDARKELEQLDHALKNARKREAKKAAGNPTTTTGRPVTIRGGWDTRQQAEQRAAELRAEGHTGIKVGKARGSWQVTYRPVFHYSDEELSNPSGKSGDFSRCVKAVSQRKGAKDPNAICAASERKRGLINPEEPPNRRAFVGPQRKDGKFPVQLVYPHSGARSQKLMTQEQVDQLRSKGYDVFGSSRGNPADSARAVSEEFHGRPVREMVPVQQKRHYHKYLAELGELRKLVVEARDGKHRVTLSGFKKAMLCTNEDKNQLFIVGGDQSVNLKDFGIKNPHEVETLGEVTRIEYFTDKEHLGSEGGTATYVHKFRSTNDNGKHKTVRMANNPDLIYYLRDEHLEFSGGSYEIRAEGIDL